MVPPGKFHPKLRTEIVISLYDAAVTPCAQQLGALAGIIDKAAAHSSTRLRNSGVLPQDH